MFLDTTWSHSWALRPASDKCRALEQRQAVAYLDMPAREPCPDMASVPEWSPSPYLTWLNQRYEE